MLPVLQSSFFSHSTQRPVSTEQIGLSGGQSPSLRQPLPAHTITYHHTMVILCYLTLLCLVQGHAIGHGSDGALVETVRVADALLALLVVGYVGEGVGLLLTSTQTQASLEVRDVVRGFARTAQLLTLSFCVETTEIIAVTHVALITTIN